MADCRIRRLRFHPTGRSFGPVGIGILVLDNKLVDSVAVVLALPGFHRFPEQRTVASPIHRGVAGWRHRPPMVGTNQENPMVQNPQLPILEKGDVAIRHLVLLQWKQKANAGLPASPDIRNRQRAIRPIHRRRQTPICRMIRNRPQRPMSTGNARPASTRCTACQTSISARSVDKSTTSTRASGSPQGDGTK